MDVRIQKDLGYKVNFGLEFRGLIGGGVGIL